MMVYPPRAQLRAVLCASGAAGCPVRDVAYGTDACRSHGQSRQQEPLLCLR